MRKLVPFLHLHPIGRRCTIAILTTVSTRTSIRIHIDITSTIITITSRHHHHHISNHCQHNHHISNNRLCKHNNRSNSSSSSSSSTLRGPYSRRTRLRRTTRLRPSRTRRCCRITTASAVTALATAICSCMRIASLTAAMILKVCAPILRWPTCRFHPYIQRDMDLVSIPIPISMHLMHTPIQVQM